ncbi:MAG TPA: zinc-dependent alcohol dehydrogenase family protein [Propionibacteriaceae bacterium]|nr:zinc-dependent alcohol dehydrogenase family protein [Propionibacteriaceae bacterium]
MKVAWMERFGEPAEVLACQELPSPDAAGRGEVLLNLVASPINPADLFLIQGIYAILPNLPYAAGMEGVARVAGRGDGVDHLTEGDLVLLPPGVGAWREQFCVAAQGLQPLPTNVDPLQLSMLAVNPPTAHQLLTSIVDLGPGEWVIQNAANSAVGRYVIQLAKTRGLRTVNVVRRGGLAESLQALGADVVAVDGEDLAERVAAATDAATIRLALDAAAGSSTMRLATCAANGATIVNYGALSLQPCQISPMQLFFERKRLQGFWIADWYVTASSEQIKTVFGELIAEISAGTLHADVEATYPLSDVQAALEHSSRSGRDGKVLLTGPGL